jgi:hypothetical protein
VNGPIHPLIGAQHRILRIAARGRWGKSFFPASPLERADRCEATVGGGHFSNYRRDLFHVARSTFPRGEGKRQGRSSSQAPPKFRYFLRAFLAAFFFTAFFFAAFLTTFFAAFFTFLAAFLAVFLAGAGATSLPNVPVSCASR